MNRSILLVFILIFNLSCGVETVLVLLPAIAANWCVQDNNCQVFEFRSSQEYADNKEKGSLGGLHYFTWNNQLFKEAERIHEGYNYIIGSWNGYNLEFEVHYRIDGRFEEYYVGSIDVAADGSKKMYLENITTREELILVTPDKCNCG